MWLAEDWKSLLPGCWRHPDAPYHSVNILSFSHTHWGQWYFLPQRLCSRSFQHVFAVPAYVAWTRLLWPLHPLLCSRLLLLWLCCPDWEQCTSGDFIPTSHLLWRPLNLLWHTVSSSLSRPSASLVLIQPLTLTETVVLHSFHQFAHPLPKLLPHRSPKEMVSLAFPLTWLFPSHPSRFWPASPLQQPPLLPLGYRLHSFLRTPTCGVAFNRFTHVSALTELLEDRACLLIFRFSCLAQYLNLTKHQ